MPDRETFTAYALANMAECACPDSEESKGARFLLDVQSATADHLDSDGDPDELHEIADGAPDVYTYGRWQEFVDLAAWQEDPTELTADASDMTATAGVCLYLIAHRLAHALVAEWATEGDDDDD